MILWKEKTVVHTISSLSKGCSRDQPIRVVECECRWNCLGEPIFGAALDLRMLIAKNLMRLLCKVKIGERKL